MDDSDEEDGAAEDSEVDVKVDDGAIEASDEVKDGAAEESDEVEDGAAGCSEIDGGVLLGAADDSIDDGTLEVIGASEVKLELLIIVLETIEDVEIGGGGA